MNEHLPESGSSRRGSGRPGVHLSGLVRAIGLPAPDTRELDPRGQRGGLCRGPRLARCWHQGGNAGYQGGGRGGRRAAGTQG